MNCHHSRFEDRIVTFKDGTKHVQRVCSDCSKKLCFVSKHSLNTLSLKPGMTSREEKKLLGIPVGCFGCRQDVRVGITGCCERCQVEGVHKQLKRYVKSLGLSSAFKLSKEQIFTFWEGGGTQL